MTAKMQNPKQDKKVAVAVTTVSNKTTFALFNKSKIERIANLIPNPKQSAISVSSLNPQLSLIAPEIDAHAIKRDGREKIDYYITNKTLWTFMNRVVNLELLSDYVEVHDDGFVELKNDSSNSSDEGKASIIQLIDKQGNNHYVLMENQDIDMINAGIAPSQSSMIQVSSIDPDVFIHAKVVDYRDMGNGVATGVFYLTGTELILPMSSFDQAIIIRRFANVDGHGYVVGGK